MVFSRQSIVAGVLLAFQLACYGPMRQYNPRTDFPQHQPGQVEITFTDGHKTAISSPRVLGDTVLEGWDAKAEKAVEFPLSSITSITGHERSAARSSLLGLGIITVIIIGGIVASEATSGEDDSSPF